MALLVASAVANWFLGGAIRRALAPDGAKTPASIRLVRLAVVLDLAVLGFYKYYDFADDELHLPLPELELTTWLPPIPRSC